MSRGKKLQEMEVKTQQSKTAVNSGASQQTEWILQSLVLTKISEVLPPRTTS